MELKEKELDNCMLAQYCLVSDSFKQDVSTEIIEFEFIKKLLKEKGGYADFKSFCSNFCSSGQGQNYCI